MKKLFLTLAMLLFAFTGVMRADVVEIGEGTATDYYLPTYNFYNYSFSQQLYTADEIGMAGTITDIAFYNAGAVKTRSIELYMLNIDKASFSGGTDWIPVAATDMVFAGTVTFAVGEWTTITLDTPFDYDGLDNLAVVTRDVTGTYSSSPHMACRVFDATGMALRAYRDASTYDPANPGVTGTVSNKKNQIQLTITPSGAGPVGPTNIVTVPDVLNMGDLPLGTDAPYWMEPYTFYFKNTGETGYLNNVINSTDAVMTVEVNESALPFKLRPERDSLLATVNYGYLNPADYPSGINQEFMIDYSAGRTFMPMYLTATPYAPVTGDVFEMPKTVTFNSSNAYTNTISGTHKNYNIPGALANANDAVYKVTFEHPTILNVNVTGANPAVAIYAECFNGEAGPM